MILAERVASPFIPKWVNPMFGNLTAVAVEEGAITQ